MSEAGDTTTTGNNNPASYTNITFDEHHDDPNADVVRVSSDNVGFRTHSWVFKKKRSVMIGQSPSADRSDTISAFIADLFDVATQGDPSHSPIHLDARSDVLRVFANLICSSDKLLLDIAVADFEPLLAIADQLQCPSVEDDLFFALRQCATRAPWDTFGLASRLNDVDLAKAALLRMGEAGNNPATRLPALEPGDFDGVRPDYIVELIKRRLVWAACQAGMGGHFRYEFWGKVASDFQVVCSTVS